MTVISLSKYAKIMRVAYPTAWRWFKQGLLKGSKKEKTGIMVPDSLLPEGIEKATDVIDLAEYARRVNEPYHRVRFRFLDGNIPASYKTPAASPRPAWSAR